MIHKVHLSMSSNLKRSKLIFLAIGVVSLVFILVSYTWNIEVIYNKVPIKIAYVQIPELHIGESNVERVNHREVIHSNSIIILTTNTAAVNNIERKTTILANGINSNSKLTSQDSVATSAARNENNTKPNRSEPRERYQAVVNQDNELKDTEHSAKEITHSPDSKSNYGVKLSNKTRVERLRYVLAPHLDTNNHHKMNTKAIGSVNSANSNNMFINHSSTVNNITTKFNDKASNFDNFKFSQERKNMLDKIHTIKSELSGHRSSNKKHHTKKHRGYIFKNNATDVLYQTERDMSTFHNVRNELKHLGLAGNFINPMVWMHGTARYHNGVLEDGVTSRPDICSSCFETNFRNIINEPEICSDGVELLILITSVISNKDSRNAIRTTWCEDCNRRESKIKYIFVFGNRNDSDENLKLLEESNQYHDIIQVDFYDTYANLTFKTISALHWSQVYCRQASFVMKTDNDMYVNTELLPLMLKAAPRESFMGGTCWGPGSPHRDIRSKWYVSYVQYSHSLFPSMCSGTGYIMSRDVVRGVLRQSPNVPFFYLEDVYVAICVKKLGVRPVSLDGFRNTAVIFEPCLYRNEIMTAHELDADSLYHIWKERNTCPKEDLMPEMVYKPMPV